MSILKKGLATSLASYITLSIGLLQTMIISRALGPELVGQMSLIRQVALVGAQIGSFGLPMSMIYFINKMKIDNKLVINSSFSLTLVLSLLSIFILYVIFSLTDFFGHISLLAFISVAGFVLFSNTRAIFHHINILNQNVKRVSYAEILPIFFSVLILLLLYLIYKDLSLESVLFISIFLWPLFGLIVVFLSLKNEIQLKWKLDKKYLNSAIKYGSQINIADFLMILNGSISLFILKYYTNDFTSVGYFSRALSLTTLINTAFISFFRILYAHWSNLDGDELKISVEKVMNFLVIVSILGCIFIAVFAKWFVLILFGEEFLPATNLARIILIGATGYLLSKALLKLFISNGNVKYNFICLAFGAISNIILSIVFIAKFGLMGAAFAQLGASFIMGIVALYLGKYKYDLSIRRILIPNLSISQIKKILSK